MEKEAKRKTQTMHIRISVILLSAMVLLSCSATEDTGSSGLISAPLMDVTGVWTGTYSTPVSNQSGRLSLNLVQTQDSTVVHGRASLGDPSCFVAGFTSGEVLLNVMPGARLSGIIMQVPSDLTRPAKPPDKIFKTPDKLPIEVFANVMKGSLNIIGPRSFSTDIQANSPCIMNVTQNGVTKKEVGTFTLTRQPL